MYHILHHEKPLELTKKDCCPLYKAKWSRSGVDLVHQSTKRKHPWQPATSKKSPSQISLPRERHGVAAVVRVRAHHAGRRRQAPYIECPTTPYWNDRPCPNGYCNAGMRTTMRCQDFPRCNACSCWRAY